MILNSVSNIFWHLDKPVKTYFWNDLHWVYFFILKAILFIYLFLERGEGREGERERNNSRLLLTCPQPGTWGTIEARALARNWTGNISVYGMMPIPLSHNRQGYFFPFWDGRYEVIIHFIERLGSNWELCPWNLLLKFVTTKVSAR